MKSVSASFSWFTTLTWLVVVVLSVLLGFGLSAVNVPAAWIVAGIVVSGATALLTNRELPLNRYVNRSGRGIIGILAALPLIGVPLSQTLSFLLPGILVTVVTLGIGIAGGMLLARSQKEISAETGILSMLAGAASLMPPLAQELGADYRYVALSQYLRMMVVSITLPVVAVLFTPPGDGAVQAEGDSVIHWGMIALIIAIALGAAPVGKWLHIPAPGVFTPMLLTVLIGLLLPEHLSMVPPEALRSFAFLVVGWMCGGALSLSALRVFARQLPATLLFIAVLMLGCALSAIPLTAWLDITYFEAYLATSPGALDTVLALSAEGGAGPVVVTIQLIRLLAVILIASQLPRLVRILSRWSQRRDP